MRHTRDDPFQTSSKVKQEIADANVLFVPIKAEQSEKDIAISEKVFARDAECFFNYLLNSGNKEIKADMCVNDDEYRILALYSEPISLTVIGTIVISSIIAPVITELILDYIRENRAKSSNKSEFRINMVIDNENGFIREIQCSGSSTEVEKVFPEVINKVLSQAESFKISRREMLQSESYLTSDREFPENSDFRK